MNESEPQLMIPELSQTTRTWVQETISSSGVDRVHWESSPTSSVAYNELRSKVGKASLKALAASKLPSLYEQYDVMMPAANTLRSTLSSSTGSLDGSSRDNNSKPSSRHRKPGRAPRFERRPVYPAPENTRFSLLSKEVADQVDRNQSAKQRAEARKQGNELKGKQRAAESLPEQKGAMSSQETVEELVDRTNVSLNKEEYWDPGDEEASLMDIDVEKQLERDTAKPEPPVANSSHSRPTHPCRLPAQHKQLSSRSSPVVDTRRSVPASHGVSKTRGSTLDLPPAIPLPRPKAQLAHSSREPSAKRDVAIPAPAPRQVAPHPTTQPRKPPVLGMRRTNTHSGVTSAFRPSQEMPMKQRGFRPPLRSSVPTASQEMPSASFPVPQRSPSPEASQERSSRSLSPTLEVGAHADSDSSYGDISLDQDTINEIMSQYD